MLHWVFAALAASMLLVAGVFGLLLALDRRVHPHAINQPIAAIVIGSCCFWAAVCAWVASRV